MESAKATASALAIGHRDRDRARRGSHSSARRSTANTVSSEEIPRGSNGQPSSNSDRTPQKSGVPCSIG